MKLSKIAVFSAPNDTIAAQHKEVLRAAAPEAAFIFGESYEDMYRVTDDVDAIVMWPAVDDKLVQFCRNAPSLKWIHCFISGVDAIVGSELNQLPVTITSTKGIHGPNISDHALAFAPLFCL